MLVVVVVELVVVVLVVVELVVGAWLGTGKLVGGCELCLWWSASGRPKARGATLWAPADASRYMDETDIRVLNWSGNVGGGVVVEVDVVVVVVVGAAVVLEDGRELGIEWTRCTKVEAAG